MASPASVDDELIAGVLAAYRGAEEKLIELMAAKTRQGLDAPEWAEKRLTVVQEYRKQAERISRVAADDAARQASRIVQEAYNRGHVDAVAELSETIRLPSTQDLGGQVDTHALTRLQETARQTVADPSAGMANAATQEMRLITLDALGPSVAGAETRRQAAQHALNRFADRGITGFTDRAGRAWQLDSYVEMAMRTQVAHARIEGHTSRMQQYGHDLVVVSSHPQHCDLCDPWTGKILSLSGTTVGVIEQSSVLDGAPVRVEVAGTLQEARDAGLFHPNCMCVYAAYQPGLTDPAFGNERDPEGDKNRQQLRYLERGVRRWKRREAAALDDAELKAARAKTREWQARIRAHTAETGMTRRTYRESITRAR